MPAQAGQTALSGSQIKPPALPEVHDLWEENSPVKIYKVFRGTEYHATLCVQSDGQKIWTFDPQWKDFWVDTDKQKMIEQAIDHDPNAAILCVENFTIKQGSA